MASALITNGVRILESIDHPTTIRVAKSITVATYSHPEPVFKYVMSPTSLVPGTVAVKWLFLF